jgi:hypothetical protein
MKFFLWLAFLSLSHLTIFAQQNEEPGYIVENNKDSVRGFIEFTNEADLSISISFRKDVTSVMKKYGPEDLSGFGIGKETFKSMRFQNTAEDSVMETAFVKQLVQGDYNLYSYQKAEREFYLLQKDTIQYFLYDGTNSETGVVFQKGNYYNYLSLISAPCGVLHHIYDRVGYNDQDMAGFISKVDNCEIGGSAVNLYQKPKTLLQPTIFAGGFPVPGYGQFTASFIMHITLPRIDKKTSVNIGLQYSNTTDEAMARTDYYYSYKLITRYQIYSLPVTIEYNFTTSRIQPYFYTGISAAYSSKTNNSQSYNIPTSDHAFGLALVGGVGIQAMILPRLFVRADWRYEVILQHPVIGIAYQF